MSRRKKKTSQGLFQEKLEILVPGDWAKHLREDARQHRTTMSRVVRDLVEQHLIRIGSIPGEVRR